MVGQLGEHFRGDTDRVTSLAAIVGDRERGGAVRNSAPCRRADRGLITERNNDGIEALLARCLGCEQQ